MKWHLEQHVRFTQSEKAQAILDDWATSRTLFTLVLPLALTQSQHPESILETNSRKKMLEELIQGEANRLIEQVHFAYEGNEALSRGFSPQYGDMDTPLICDLLTQSGVLHRAHQLVKGQFEGEVEQSRAVKRLFELRDKNCWMRCSKISRKPYRTIAMTNWLYYWRLNECETTKRLWHVVTSGIPIRVVLQSGYWRERKT